MKNCFKAHCCGFLISSLCIISCSNQGKLHGTAYVNKDAGIRFLVSDSGKQTEIDGFIVDKNVLVSQEWYLEYDLSKSDFPSESEIKRFGKFDIWSDSKTKHNGINYDELKGRNPSIIPIYNGCIYLHFHFFDVETGRDFDKKWLNNDYIWPSKIDITININDSDLEEIEFLYFDNEYYSSFCNIFIIFLFEDINGKTNKFVDIKSQNNLELIFHIKASHIFHKNHWDFLHHCWTGSQYYIVVNDETKVAYKGYQIVDYSYAIWERRL